MWNCEAQISFKDVTTLLAYVTLANLTLALAKVHLTVTSARVYITFSSANLYKAPWGSYQDVMEAS